MLICNCADPNSVCNDLHVVLLYRDYDGKVTPEELAAAAMYLKDTLGKEGVQELISNLSKDTGYFPILLKILSAV